MIHDLGIYHDLRMYQDLLDHDLRMYQDLRMYRDLRIYHDLRMYQDHRTLPFSCSRSASRYSDYCRWSPDSPPTPAGPVATRRRRIEIRTALHPESAAPWSGLRFERQTYRA